MAAYAQSRGMRPREVLQALVNSMEKTLRKEKGESLAGQTSSLKMSQQEEAAGKPEVKLNPGRGGRDLRERKVENNCVACSKDKKRGGPPKTRWKEEQKEKARSQEAQGTENRAIAMPNPEGAVAAPAAEGSKPQHAPEEIRKDAGSSKGENTQTLVACITGVPRGPANTGEVVRVTPTGSDSGGSRGILYEINQQYLRSKYKFKEGAPLKEYLRQRMPNLGDTCTLWEVHTWLKEIFRDNLLLDESNPAMIVGDAPLEAALRKKRVHVNEIGGVVQQQLTMVEVGQGPLSARMLSGGTVYEGIAPGNPIRGPDSDNTGQHHQCESPESHGNSGWASRVVQSGARQQLSDHRHGLIFTPTAEKWRFSPATACDWTERGGSACCSHTGGVKLHRSSGASAEPRARCCKRTRA